MEEKNKELMEQFARINALLHRYQAFHFRSNGTFASPLRGQGRVLSLLKLQPEISQKDLGYLLDMRNQSLGELLAKLERNGHITRTPSEKDRRVMNIKLTDQGAASAEKLENKQEDMDNLFDCFSSEEQETLGKLLERLTTSLDKAFEDMGCPIPEPGHPVPHPHGKEFGHHHGFECHRNREHFGPEFDGPGGRGHRGPGFNFSGGKHHHGPESNFPEGKEHQE